MELFFWWMVINTLQLAIGSRNRDLWSTCHSLRTHNISASEWLRNTTVYHCFSEIGYQIYYFCIKSALFACIGQLSKCLFYIGIQFYLPLVLSTLFYVWLLKLNGTRSVELETFQSGMIRCACRCALWNGIYKYIRGAMSTKSVKRSLACIKNYA